MQPQLELARNAISRLPESENGLANVPTRVTYSEPPLNERDWQFRDYFRAVRKRLGLVIGLVAFLTAGVGLYMALQPNRYEGRVQLQVDLENSNPIVGPSRNSPVIVNNAVNDPAYFGTQLQILSGPRLLQRVIRKLDLEHNPTFASTNQKPWSRFTSLTGRSKTATDTNAVSELPFSTDVPATMSRDEIAEAARLAPLVLSLQENLTVDPVKESRLPNKTTRLINLRFETPNPLMAAKVVNTLADTYVAYNLEVISGANETMSGFLQKQIAELQGKIRDAEERLINYSRSNQILSLDGGQNTTTERLLGLNQQLLQAENERKLAESVYRASLEPGAAESLAEGNYSQLPGVETTAAAQISKARSQLADLRQKRAELLVQNTEEWPEVKEIDQQITVLQNQLNESLSRAIGIVKSNLATRYRQALAHEQALRTAFNQQKEETLTQNEAAINYKIIQQEIETNKGLLDSLLQRAKQTDVSAAGVQNNIHVIDYAVVPTEPVGPKRLLNTTLAFVLSVVLAIGIALLLEYLDDTIQTPEDVQRTLGLATLSLIPAVGGRLRTVLAGFQRGQRGVVNAQHPELLTHTSDQSSLAEAYRHLRTSMLLSTDGPGPQTLLITSSQANEGKSTTTVNMGVSLTQIGANVLLIDADMHRPCLHQIFALNNGRGLSTLLTDDSAHDPKDVITRSESGISVLPAGPIPENPTELLCKDEIKNVLHSLRSEFDYILIDSPPITMFTDSVILSPMVDGVLLVVQGSKVSRDLVRCSKDILGRVGARIFGVILNNVRPSRDDYFYFCRYRETI